jgi:hypothetical protein
LQNRSQAVVGTQYPQQQPEGWLGILTAVFEAAPINT